MKIPRFESLPQYWRLTTQQKSCRGLCAFWSSLKLSRITLYLSKRFLIALITTVLVFTWENHNCPFNWNNKNRPFTARDSFGVNLCLKLHCFACSGIRTNFFQFLNHGGSLDLPQQMFYNIDQPVWLHLHRLHHNYNDDDDYVQFELSNGVSKPELKLIENWRFWINEESESDWERSFQIKQNADFCWFILSNYIRRRHSHKAQVDLVKIARCV